MSSCYQMFFLSGFSYYVYATTTKPNIAQKLFFVKQKFVLRVFVLMRFHCYSMSFCIYAEITIYQAELTPVKQSLGACSHVHKHIHGTPHTPHTFFVHTVCFLFVLFYVHDVFVKINIILLRPFALCI